MASELRGVVRTSRRVEVEARTLVQVQDKINFYFYYTLYSMVFKHILLYFRFFVRVTCGVCVLHVCACLCATFEPVGV